MPDEGQANAFDLLVIGGGINGAGIARDAAGRGLRVLLCEKGDLGGATSSASTKLIHGGLRYLEYYEFKLVREALREREVLLRLAPHVVWPLRFVLPHDAGQRPAWMIRLGLFLYDHLGGRQRLPASRSLNLRQDPAGQLLKPEFRKAFEYSDCWVEDARLVVLNALDAQERGAEVLVRTRCSAARRVEGGWQAILQDEGGRERHLFARAVVNAAGPWVSDVLQKVTRSNRPAAVRLIKGSHIVVPRLQAHDRAYIFQNPDGRIVFAIPYEQKFTLIGTTDVPFEGDAADVRISTEEIEYLCGAINRYLQSSIQPADVVWSYAGVRPLYDDRQASASAVTRDYVFDLDEGTEERAPLLSIFGGKITTYRKLAEHALERLLPLLGTSGQPWTGDAPLPGGDMPNADFDDYLHRTIQRYAHFPPDLLKRWLRAYGTRTDRLLDGRDDLKALGQDFGGGLYEAELDYLMRYEWARTAEDVLWRRSKLGLHLPSGASERVADWFGETPLSGEVAKRAGRAMSS